MKSKSVLKISKNIIMAGMTLICLAAIGLYVYTHLIIKADYQPVKYEATVDTLDNPYQGFYELYCYDLKDNPQVSADQWCENILSSSSSDLILLEFNLKAYADKDLSKDAKNQISTVLKNFSDSNKQLILRFLYDTEGNAISSEPSSLDIVENHIAQTAEIVNDYKENVYIVQGNFTGDYGELHDGNYSDTDSFDLLMAEMNDQFDSDIYLSVRTPAQWRQASKSTYAINDVSSLDDDVITTRLGLFNDGMLSSLTDYGTYSETEYTEEFSGDYTYKQNRAQEIDFQDDLCQYVPNGGEVIVDNPYNDIDNAVADLSAMHVSYLNRDYDTDVLNKWKNSSYEDQNGYDYIASHLGYRFGITSSNLSFHTLWSDKATISFQLTNTGFSPAYKDFKTTLLFVNASNGEIELTKKVDLKIRRVASGDTWTNEVEVDARKMKSGTYNIYVQIKDPDSGKIIKLDNLDQDEELGVHIGTLTIKGHLH